MSDQIIKYIGFDDKQESLPISSRFLITSKDANDIKDVVNTLAKKVEKGLANFKNIFKLMQVNVPKTLDPNKTYDLLIEFSDDSKFNQVYSSISILSRNSRYYIFRNNKWEKLNDLIGSAEFGTDVSVQIDKNIRINKPTYVRYAFTDSLSNIEHYSSIVLGTNEYHNDSFTVPIAVTISRDDEQYQKIVKESAKNIVLNLDFLPDTYEANPFLDFTKLITYLKFDSIDDSTDKYLSHSHLAKVNEYTVDATPITSFEVKEIDSEDDMILNEVIARTVFNGDVYISRYYYFIRNDRVVGIEPNVPTVNPGEQCTLTKFIRSKYNTMSQDIDVSYSTTDPNIIIDGQRITAASNEDGFGNFTVLDKEYPVNVLGSSLAGISAVFSRNIVKNGNSIIDYNIVEINEKGEEFGPVEDERLAIVAVGLINDGEIEIRKNEKKIKFNDFTHSHDCEFLFKYRKDNRTFIATKLVKVKAQHPISLDFQVSGGVNPSLVSAVLTYRNSDGEKQQKDVQNNIIVRTNGYLAENSTLEQQRSNNSVDPVIEQIKAIYKYNDEYLVEDEFISLPPMTSTKSMNIQAFELGSFIPITGKLNPSATYILSATQTLADGTVLNTNDSCVFSLNTGSYDELMGRLLTTSDERASRILVIDCQYENPINGEPLFGEKSFYVPGFGFNNGVIRKQSDGTILGDDEDENERTNADIISCGTDGIYYFEGYYNNGQHSILSANWTLKEVTSNGETISTDIDAVYNENTKMYRIHTRRSLFDKILKLSAEYEEPGYEDFEHCLTSGKIIIKGGYTLTLNGNIVTENELINFNDSSIKLEAISHDAYVTALRKNFTSSNNQAVTSSMMQAINDTVHNFDFATITNRNNAEETYEIPYDCLSSTIPELRGGNEYEFKFFDMLSSEWCSENSYDNMKDNLVIEKTFERDTEKYLSDHEIMGRSPFGYENVIISYKDYNNEWCYIGAPKKVTDSFIFNRNMQYKLEYYPISNINSSYNAEIEFQINKQFPETYVLGISNINFGYGIQILDIIPTYETRTGFMYKQKMLYLPEYDLWIPKEINREANKLVKIKIAFAFIEYQEED